MLKKSISFLLAICMVCTFSLPTFAAEANLSAAERNRRQVTIGDYINESDKPFFEKLTKIYSTFELDENNNLVLTLTDTELAENYKFTSTEIEQIHNLIKFQHNAIIQEGNAPASRLHVSDWKIYFDVYDVHSYLFAAAQIGPAAIMAALSALGSVYPGVGTVVGAIVGVVGGGAIIYTVFQAVAMNKGVYIGIDWDGPFPNPALGTW